MALAPSKKPVGTRAAVPRLDHLRKTRSAERRDRLDKSTFRAMRGAGASGRTAGGAERFVHYFADGARAAAALRAAAETAIDLTRRSRRRRAHGAAYLVVAEHIAGADDHGGPRPVVFTAPEWPKLLMASLRQVKEKRSLKTF